MSLRAARLVVALIVTAGSVSFATQSAQRDATPAVVVGTGEVRGVVVSDESTPLPIRRAIVTVSGGDAATSRSVLTDDAGTFSVGRLPTGRFMVSVKKAAYLAAAYGAMKPGRQGSEIVLAADARASIRIVMSRGAVIAGALRDEAGAPLSGLTVYAMDLHTPGGVDSVNAADQVTTDDRGVYRFFGLMPSEYVIAATPTVLLGGTIGARSETDMDALLGELTKRNATGAAMTSGNAPPPPMLPMAPAVGFAPVFYPGAATYAEAVHLRVAAGEERSGVDFTVIPVPVASVSGTITGDVPNLAMAQLSVISSTPRLLSMSGVGITLQSTDADGRFKLSNLPPGLNRIVARVQRPPGQAMFGMIDVDVRGQDLTGLSITLQPGATLSGRLLFDPEHAPVPADLSRLRVSLSPPNGAFAMSSGPGMVLIGNGMISVPSVPAQFDGTFELTGIGPAVYTLSCIMPPDLAAVWRVQSAIVNGRDLLDAPMEFTPGQSVKGAVVTLSDKHTEIAGALKTAAGQPAAAYFVVAFPADRSLWKSGPRRLRSTRPATDGRFSIVDLPAGIYLIAALTDLDPNDWQDAEFLEQVAPAGVTVVLRDGEKKTQDLQIVR